MLKLTHEQTNAIGSACNHDDVDILARQIYELICEIATEDIKNATQAEAIVAIRQTILVAQQYQIGDFEDLATWSYLRLATGIAFYGLPQFSKFLSDPLFHPKSKARNIVIAFQNASKEGSKWRDMLQLGN